MHHITKLNNNQQITREWVADLRAHLMSPKFTGTEPYAGEICPNIHCKGTGMAGSYRLSMIEKQQGRCINCDTRLPVERKDWIATADVLRQLDTLESTWLS